MDDIKSEVHAAQAGRALAHGVPGGPEGWLLVIRVARGKHPLTLQNF